MPYEHNPSPEKRAEWQQELDSAMAEEGKHTQPGRLTDEWAGEMREWYSKNPGSGFKDVSVRRDWEETEGSRKEPFFSSYSYWNQTTTQDVTRWKTGSYTWSWSDDTKDMAIIVSDAVIRTANAVANRPITINGKEQYLTLKIGSGATDADPIVNTANSATVFMHNDWIKENPEFCRNKGVEVNSNEAINDLCQAYSGQALVLATSKRTMDMKEAFEAQQLTDTYRNPEIGDHLISLEVKVAALDTEKRFQEVLKNLKGEPALTLWRGKEYSKATQSLIKDWPGFQGYVDKARERQDAGKKMNQLVQDVEHALQKIEPIIKKGRDILKVLQEEADRAGGLHNLGANDLVEYNGQKSLVLRNELRSLNLKARLTAAAIAYQESGETTPVTLQPDIMEAVRKFGRAMAGGSLNDSVTRAEQILQHFYQQLYPPTPEGKGEGNNPDNDGPCEPGKGGDPSPTDGKNPGPFQEGKVDPSSKNPTFDSVTNADSLIQKTEKENSDSESLSDTVSQSMNPDGIPGDPLKINGVINFSFGVIRGHLIRGHLTGSPSQVEYLRQLSDPITRVVRNKVSFRATAPCFEVVGLRQGDIDESNLPYARHDPKVFKRNEAVSRPSLVVGMLLDQSGSMCGSHPSRFRPDLQKIRALLPSGHPGRSLVPEAKLKGRSYSLPMSVSEDGYGSFGIGSYAIMESPKDLHSSICRSDQVAAVAAGIVNGLHGFDGVEFYVSGFWSSGAEKSPRLKGVFEPGPLPGYITEDIYPTMEMFEYVSRSVGRLSPREVLQRLTAVGHGHANADGFAVMHAAARMKQLYPDIPHRVLFVLSDGQPSSCAKRFERKNGKLVRVGTMGTVYGGTNGMQHIRQVTHWARVHQKVQVLGIGVANAYEILEGRLMYGENNFTILEDVESAGGVIASFLSRTFHKLGV